MSDGVLGSKVTVAPSKPGSPASCTPFPFVSNQTLSPISSATGLLSLTVRYTVVLSQATVALSSQIS